MEQPPDKAHGHLDHHKLGYEPNDATNHGFFSLPSPIDLIIDATDKMWM